MTPNKPKEAENKLQIDMLQSLCTSQKVEVGICNESNAQYAIYQAYGLVQRGTDEQAEWFANPDISHPPHHGTPLVLPSHPLFEVTNDACSEDWSHLFTEPLKVLGPNELVTALQFTAQKAAEDFRDKARNSSTCKGSAHRANGDNGSTAQPLVKTGAMLNSIVWNLRR